MTAAKAVVQPYLFFEGRCEEALAFYGAVFGARVEMLMRFRDSPEPAAENRCAPGDGDKILHASFRIGDTELMASDGMARGQPRFEGIALSVTASDPAEADRLCAALADGGTVQMAPAKTFFSPRFGMVADKFGVSWMVMVPMPA